MEPWFESRPPSQVRSSQLETRNSKIEIRKSKLEARVHLRCSYFGGRSSVFEFRVSNFEFAERGEDKRTMDPVQHKLKVFTGNAHPALAREICAQLKVPLGQAYVGRFPDGEVRLQILENVRGADVFVIQPTCNPVNDNLMELLVMLDALRRASAERVTAVIPYYGYARQDRKDRPRVPISAKLIADLLTSSGANRVLALDLHAGQIQGFFNIPVDHLYATPVTVRYFRRLKLKDPVVVSPDTGGVERARAFAKRLNAP